MTLLLKDVLQELDWSDGTHIPIANEENNALEITLNARIKEFEKLKEENEALVALQNEVDFHHKNIQAEHNENMQLISVHKEQIANEENYARLTSNEISRFNQDIVEIGKQRRAIEDKGKHVQADISQILRRVEYLRTSLGGEQTSLDEWQTALKRSEHDIDTFASFNKQDSTNINDLEIKRQHLKIERDKRHAVLSNLCGNIFAEEKSAERISNQVMEAVNNRNQIVSTWAAAVDNLRQRNVDIQQLKKELKMLHVFSNNQLNVIRDKEAFLKLQLQNNTEVERELSEFNTLYSHKQKHLRLSVDSGKSLELELVCSKKELVNMSNELNHCRTDNKRCAQEIENKQRLISQNNDEVCKYKEKISEIIDESRSAVQRFKQLEDMYNNEEKYIKQTLTEIEREQNHIVSSQQQLFKLKSEEERIISEIKAYKSAMSHMDTVLLKIQKDLSLNKENTFNMSYQLAMAMSCLRKLEGDAEDTTDYELLHQRAEQLDTILQERTMCSAKLASQISKIDGDLRLMMRNISANRAENEMLKNRLNELMADAEGAAKEEQSLRKHAREQRAEEITLQLKIQSIEKNLKHLYEKEDMLTRAHLDLQAAISERRVEIKEKIDVFTAHRRILQKEKGNLLLEIKNEQSKVKQLKNRYDIYISALGKNEDGEMYSVAYFKVKYAQEKSELQQEGDLLDAQIRKSEEEITALEATLKVVDAANKKFVRNMDAVKEDDPEMLEFNKLCDDYDNWRTVRSEIVTQARNMSKKSDNLKAKLVKCDENISGLQITREDLIDEFISLKKDLKEQLSKLGRARDLQKKSAKSVKRKIKSSDIWKIHEKDIFTKMLSEANRSASIQLNGLNSQIVNNYANEFDINLIQIKSAPQSKSKLSSTLSSPSPQESWIQTSIIGSRSDVSNSGGESSVGIQSDRDKSSLRPDGTSADLQEFRDRRRSINQVPLNVVMLDMDSKPSGAQKPSISGKKK